MKKKITVITFVLVSLLILIIAFCLKSILELRISQSNNTETFLLSSLSPEGDYMLEAYKTEPGATVDFSIKVYLVSESKKNLIYNAYHEYQADIFWINKSKVSINGNNLDLSKGETYDWRKNQ